MEKHMQSALGTPEQTANHTSAGVEMPDDPMSILTDVYKDLSKDQCRAIMGFMYVIGTADGTSENTVINNPMFLNQLRTLGLAWSECKTQLTEKGEDYIYQQLKGIDSGLAAMLMFNAFPLTGDNETGPVEKIHPILRIHCVSRPCRPTSHTQGAACRHRRLSERKRMEQNSLRE